MRSRHQRALKLLDNRPVGRGKSSSLLLAPPHQEGDPAEIDMPIAAAGHSHQKGGLTERYPTSTRRSEIFCSRQAGRQANRKDGYGSADVTA